MKNRIALVVLAALAAASCQSAKGPAFTSGLVRTAVSGSWSTTDVDPGSDVDTLGLGLQVGTLLVPDFEAGAEVNYSDVDLGAGPSLTEWLLAGYGRYYFQNSGPLRGWGQARLGWLSSDVGRTDDNSFSWQLALGASQFVTDSTALEAAITYGQHSLDLGRRAGDTDFATTSLVLGYALYY